MVDYRRVSEVLVGLEGVEVVGAEETGGFLVVEVRLVERPRCGGCGGRVLSKGWKGVRLVDQPCFGRSVRMVWRKRRWVCPVAGCGVGSFTERAPWVAPVRARLTTRAARWATRQVGEGRTVSEAAKELRCSWHTVSKEVNRWGEALLEADRDRVGEVEALGLDETLFLRQGSRRRRMWVTSAVDIRNSRLIDVFPGKTAKDAARWLLEQPAWWRDNIRWASLDLSGAYRAAYNQALPQAVQIADPFHVVRLANLLFGPGAPPRARRNPRTPRKERRRPIPDTQTPHPRPRTARRPRPATTDRPAPRGRPPRRSPAHMTR